MGRDRRVTQNVISATNGATGDVIENAEVVFSAEGKDVLACSTWIGGKDWESVYDFSAILVIPKIIGKTSI